MKRDEGNEIVRKKFNVSADCKPQLHYMVDLSERLEKIKTMIDAGEYFTVNRARQYGKTTTLKALERFLENEYLVVAIDFQMVSYSDFEKEELFVEAFSREVLDAAEGKEEIPQEIRDGLALLADGKSERRTLSGLFRCLSKWCLRRYKK